jgi:hypothetical protein
VTSFWPLASVLLALAGPQTTQPNAQNGGEEYAPAGGNFSIRFPGKPKETTQVTKSPIGDVKVYTATYAHSDGNVYMISYSDLPSGAAKPENLGTLFDGVREGAKGSDGTVLKGDRVEFGPDKLPAYDLEVKKGNQHVMFKIIVRDNRLYQLALVGSASFVEKSKNGAAFLKSFEFSK